MVGELDHVLAELKRVEDQLFSLADDAYDEKYALMIRKEELTTRAARTAEAVGGECSTQELLTRLAGLRRKQALLARQHGAAHHGAHRPRHSSTRIDHRIERICSILADRGIYVR